MSNTNGYGPDHPQQQEYHWNDPLWLQEGVLAMALADDVSRLEVIGRVPCEWFDGRRLPVYLAMLDIEAAGNALSYDSVCETMRSRRADDGILRNLLHHPLSLETYRVGEALRQLERLSTINLANRAVKHLVNELGNPSRPTGEVWGEYLQNLNGIRPVISIPPADDAGTPEMSLWSAGDLLKAEFPDLVWIADGLLGAGLYILAGRPKLGKSWLALQLAISVATGGVLFGQTLTPRRVLYLGLEDSERRLQSRIQTLQCPSNGQLDFITSWSQLVDDGLDKLIALLETGGYELVIIDTLARIARTRRKEQETIIAERIDMLQRWAGEHNVAVLFVHHHRKSGASISDLVDDVMGATSLTGSADGVLGLYRGRGQRGAELRMTGRDLPERELALEFDRQLNCWQLIGEAGTVRSDSIQGMILAVLASDFDGAATVAELAQALERHRENIRKEVEELVTKGKLERAGAKGRQHLYRLVTKHLP